MPNQHTYETIDAYLNGTLTGAELEAFEQELQNNADLLEEVQLIRNVDATLSEEVDLAFQQMLDSESELFLSTIDWEEEVKAEKQPTVAATPIRRIGGWSRKWAIAASLLFLVISALLLWQLQTHQPSSNEDLFVEYFETYRLNKSIRGTGDLDAEFQKGLEYYNAKNYTAAAEIFETLASIEIENSYLTFCLGNAYLNQNPSQLDLAAEQFQKIIADGASVQVPKAQWYLALIAVKKGNLEKAKTLLEEVKQSGDSFTEKAKILLEEL